MAFYSALALSSRIHVSWTGAGWIRIPHHMIKAEKRFEAMGLL